MSIGATGGIIFDQAGKELSQTEISDIGTVICFLALEIEQQIFYAYFA